MKSFIGSNVIPGLAENYFASNLITQISVQILLNGNEKFFIILRKKKIY